MAKNNKNGVAQPVVEEESFVQKNLKKIAICVAVLIVAIIAAILINNFLERRNQKAAEAMFPCEQLFQQGQFEKALAGDGQQVLGFAEVVKKYGRTKSGNLAKLYAGLASAQTGKYEDAEKYLKDFDTKKDAMISPAALGALGNVYAQLGQNDKAVETLKKAAKKADNNVLSPVYLVQAAELLEADGKTDEALKLYEEVKASYRASQQGQEIDKYIERAKAVIK